MCVCVRERERERERGEGSGVERRRYKIDRWEGEREQVDRGTEGVRA